MTVYKCQKYLTKLSIDDYKFNLYLEKLNYWSM